MKKQLSFFYTSLNPFKLIYTTDQPFYSSLFFYVALIFIICAQIITTIAFPLLVTVINNLFQTTFLENIQLAKKHNDILESHSLSFLFILYVISPALIEEFIFRFPLKFTNSTHCYLFVFSLILSIIGVGNLYLGIILLLINGFVFFRYQLFEKFEINSENFKHHALSLIVLNTFNFCLIHWDNYHYTLHNFILIILDIGLMFIGIMYLSQIRIRFGMFPAILLHAINNLTFLLLYKM